MKNIFTAIILLGLIITATPAAKAANSIRSSGTTFQQTDTLRHKVYKKRKRIVRRVSTRKSARMQMQLQQADKHLREEQKVQKAQQELKKDTLQHR